MTATPSARRGGPDDRPRWIDRALRLVGDVRPGEGAKAAVLGLTLFVLLTAYYLLKVAREELVLTSYEAETKVYIAAGQAVLLVPAVALYGWLSSRVGRFRLLVAVTLFFASNLAIFAGLHAAGVPIALPFYVWVGVFSVFVIALLWAFANDVYDEASGRRLFAVIGLGSSIGAIVGAYAAEPIGDLVGTLGTFVVALVLLLSTLAGSWWVHTRSRDVEAARAGEHRAEAAAAAGGKNVFSLFVSDRYFVLVGLMLLLLNCENTVGEYLIDRVLQNDIRADLGATPDAGLAEARVREFKSIYFGAVNTAGFLIQLLLTGRIMKRGGAGAAILVLPTMALLGQLGVLAAGLALTTLAIAKVTENSLDYSLNNTARNALFLVVPRDAKYKVKVFVDSVFVRLGDVAAGGLVLLASSLGLQPVTLLALATGISATWLGIALWLHHEHKRRLAAAPPAGDEAPAKPEPTPPRSRPIGGAVVPT